MTKTPVLLVSGSRKTPLIGGSNKMHIGYFEAIIDRALANGWHVIVGDAIGVDQSLAYAATNYKYHKNKPFMMVYGIQDRPRHNIASSQVLYTDVSEKCKTYTARDDFMLSQADFVYCIWNGTSKGTRRVYERAIRAGKIDGVNVWIKEVIE